MVKGQGYLSFLLRLWQVGGGQGATWRVSLEEIPTGERRAFASLDDLFGYLSERTKPRALPGEAAASEEGRSDRSDAGATPGVDQSR